MDGATLQTRVDRGFAIASTHTGTPYTHFRANGSDNPTASTNQIDTLNAFLTTDAALKGTAAMAYGKPTFYAAIERNGLALGDYLIGQYGTFFVASTIYPSPVALTYCNRTISIARALDNLIAGSTGTRRGLAVNDAAPFMTGWPAFVSQLSSGSKMIGSGMGLPSDGKLPGAAVYLPSTTPEIRFNDIITDDFGQRYTVASAELTALGWRLTAEMWPAG